jgi:ribA/ribD-fused uncharacterized protein
LKHRFANFSPFDLFYQGKRYLTAEHLFQALKFIGHAPDVAERIRSCRLPREALDMARRFRSMVRQDWFAVNVKSMDEVPELNFKQYPDLANILKKTRGRDIVEASPVNRSD